MRTQCEPSGGHEQRGRPSSLGVLLNCKASCRQPQAQCSIRSHAISEPQLSPTKTGRSPSPATKSTDQPAFDAAAAWQPGTVFDVTHPSQFKAFGQQVSHERPVLLMCKAQACRPCKVFSRTYERYAAANPAVAFLSVVGDASPELRRMMILLKIGSTPSFVMFKDEQLVHQHSGRSDEKLDEALDKAYATLPPGTEPADRIAAREAAQKAE